MRNPGGYAFAYDIGGAKREADTFTCQHCNHVVHVKPGAIPDEFGSMCRNCMKMVCARCAAGPCTPWLKKLEAYEARDRRLREYGV